MSLPHRVATIIRIVAAEHGVNPEDIMSDTRLRPVARARQEAMRVCRGLEWGAERKPPSFLTIGRWFNRDHTTVLHACRDMATEEQGLLAL